MIEIAWVFAHSRYLSLFGKPRHYTPAINPNYVGWFGPDTPVTPP